MKGKKSAMGGLPVAPVKNNPDTAGKATTDVVFGNPEVISSAKKKTVPGAQGTAAKPRSDRAAFKHGGHVKHEKEHEREHHKHGGHVGKHHEEHEHEKHREHHRHGGHVGKHHKDGGMCD